jgi:hypothetical protein
LRFPSSDSFRWFCSGSRSTTKISVKTLCMVDIKLYMLFCEWIIGKDSVRRKMTIDHNNKKESYVWAENIFKYIYLQFYKTECSWTVLHFKLKSFLH